MKTLTEMGFTTSVTERIRTLARIFKAQRMTVLDKPILPTDEKKVDKEPSV